MRFLSLILLAPLLLATPALAEDDPNAVRTEVVTLKHVDAEDVIDVLDPFRSRVGQIRFNRDLNILTISDRGPLVEQMLAVIERLDVAQAELELTVFLIEASPDGKADPKLVSALGDVWPDLAGLFSYKGYAERDRAILRVTAGRMASQRIGGDDGYMLDVTARELDRAAGTFQLGVSIYRRTKGESREGGTIYLNDTLVSTTLEVKDGKTSVVGASRLNGDGRALITVIKTEVAE